VSEPDDDTPGTVSLSDLAVQLGVPLEDDGHRFTVDTDDDEVPAIVAGFLLPFERKVIAVRRHQVVLLPPAAVLVGGLAAAVALNGWAYESGVASLTLVRLIWIAWTAGALWATWKWLGWHYTWFAATPVRLLFITGIVSRKVTPLPLTRLSDLRMHQAIGGRRYGWGTLICESFATDHALHRVTYLPHLQSLFNEIWLMRLGVDKGGR
jgi:hypothetical protein